MRLIKRIKRDGCLYLLIVSLRLISMISNINIIIYYLLYIYNIHIDRY